MTKTPTHTPGPWQLGGWGEVYSPGIMPMAAAGPLPTAYKIAKVPFGSETTNALGVRAEESRANQRLIAAAPDLLAALMSLTDKIEKGTVVSTDSRLDIITQARAAIAKAEGK